MRGRDCGLAEAAGATPDPVGEPDAALSMGDLSTGFVALEEGRLELVLRADHADAVASLLRAWARRSLPPARSLAGGRGGAAAHDLAAGLTVVLRPCRRGGFVARFNQDLYLGFSPRPFRELAVTEELRARGVPTVEMLGAAACWVLPGCYRGALVSRELSGVVNLWEYLRFSPPAERERVCELAAALTRRMHDAGIVHPDLNLQNYLVRRAEPGGDAQVFVIDCDRAEVRTVTAADRRGAFKRLCRSMRRLDPTAAVLTLGCVEAFHRVEGPS